MAAGLLTGLRLTGAHRIVDQRFAERPDGTRNAVRTRNDRIECIEDPIAVVICNHERREYLDRMAVVTRHLAKNLVILEQWNCDQLTEQTLARALEQVPRGFQLERTRLAEFDTDHQALAAHLLEQLVARDQIIQLA